MANQGKASDSAVVQSKAQRYGTDMMTDFTETLLRSTRLRPLRVSDTVVTHVLVAEKLLLMFTNIVQSAVNLYHRDLGVRTLTEPSDVDALRNCAESIAYEALCELYGVLFRKASRTGLSHTLRNGFGETPYPSNKYFPAGISALINSAGPIEFGGSIHVPVIRWTDIEAACKPGYKMNALMELRTANSYHGEENGDFDFGFCPGMIAFTPIQDLVSTQSSPWWTFHAYRRSDKQYSGDISISLYSPFAFEACEHALKFAVLFAGGRLTEGVGIVHYSTTLFYETNQEEPDLAFFPSEIWEYPFFNKGFPAYYAKVEPHPQNSGSATLSLSGQSREEQSGRGLQPNEHSTSSPLRKRKRVDDETITADRNPSQMTYSHRVVFHYFDHIPVDNADDHFLSVIAGIFHRA